MTPPSTEMEAGPGQISRALVRRAQAGDRGATDELFPSLYNELHRLARREVYRSGEHVYQGRAMVLAIWELPPAARGVTVQ